VTTSARSGQRLSLWVGGVALAGVLLATNGLFNIVAGLSAIFTDDVFVTTRSGALVLDVTSWGWVHLVLGLVLLGTGIALFTGNRWARLVAVTAVTVNMVSQLMAMPAYPAWSLLIIALDVAILWAVIVHGEELAS